VSYWRADGSAADRVTVGSTVAGGVFVSEPIYRTALEPEWIDTTGTERCLVGLIAQVRLRCVSWTVHMDRGLPASARNTMYTVEMKSTT